MAAFAQKEHAIETAYYATLPTGYREPVISKSGFGSIPAKTIIEVFKSTVEKHGSRNALALKRPVQVGNLYFMIISYYILSKISTNKAH